jgi:ABC-type transporter Mla subunit MlaD
VKSGAEAEAKYFAAKKQYANIASMQDYSEMASNMDKAANSTNEAKASLEKFVDGFTDGRGIITGFTTDANGISKINFSVLDEATGYLRNFSAEMGQFTSNVYTFETTMGNMTAGTKAVESALESMSKLMARLNGYGFTKDNNDSVKELFELMQALNELRQKKGASKNVDDQLELQNAAFDAERQIKNLKALENAYLKVHDAAKDGAVEEIGKLDKSADAYTQLTESVKKFAETMNGSVVDIGAFNGEIKNIPVSIETADGELKKFIVNVDKLSNVMTAMPKSVEKAKTGWGELGSSLGGLGKEILKYGSTLVGVYDFVRYLKQGFNEVLEIDTAMTELKKVTEETDVAYSNFLKNAYTSSKKIGTTMKDFTQATADFARLGYTLDEASMLAEAANVYMNVGDGIEDVGAASESIISTMKAFGIEATESMGIVDRFNEVGKILPVDNYIG